MNFAWYTIQRKTESKKERKQESKKERKCINSIFMDHKPLWTSQQPHSKALANTHNTLALWRRLMHDQTQTLIFRKCVFTSSLLFHKDKLDSYSKNQDTDVQNIPRRTLHDAAFPREGMPNVNTFLESE